MSGGGWGAGYAQDPYAPYPGERPKPMGDVFKSLLPGSRRKSNAAADAQLAAAQPVTTHGPTQGGVLTSAPPAHGHTAGGGGGGGGIASKIPGTKAYEAAHPGHEHAHGTKSTAPMGAAGFGQDGSRPGGYGATSTEATVGSGHGGAGVASMVPGTKAHSAAHASLSFLFSLFLRGSGFLPRPSLTLSPRSAPKDDHHSAHAHHVAGSTGLKPGDPGTTTTATTTTVPKPSFGDKLSGKVDVAIGKLTHNPGKVAIGEIKQTEGKAAAEHSGLGAGHHVGGTGAGAGGHTVHGAPHAAGRY